MLLFDKIFRACLMKNRYNAPRPTTLYTSRLSILDFFRNKSSHYFLLPHINGLPSHYGCSLLFFSRWKIPVPKERVIISLYSKAYIRRWENGALSLSLFFTLKISFRVIWWGKKRKEAPWLSWKRAIKAGGAMRMAFFCLVDRIEHFPAAGEWRTARLFCFELCVCCVQDVLFRRCAGGNKNGSPERHSTHTPPAIILRICRQEQESRRRAIKTYRRASISGLNRHGCMYM